MAYESSPAFYRVYAGLTRIGPGSEESTARALRCIPQMRPDAPILDIGCGPGQQTLVLARILNRAVDAIDIHQPFLDQLKEASKIQGLSHLIRTRKISMDMLDYAPGSIDLIWCESAIYHLGVQNALRLWLPLLTADGFVCFTEISWLNEERPAEIRGFWQGRYPEMESVQNNIRRIEAAGFTVADSFLLPREDDWTHFYTPLSARVAEFQGAAVDDETAAVLANAQVKMEMQERYWGCYGHIFYICKVNSRGSCCTQKELGV
jgi:SAM-dependent methyltransferase